MHQSLVFHCVLWISEVTFVVDGEDDSASSVPTTCHDTNQWEHLMREVHGCRQFGKTLRLHSILS